MFGNEVTVDHAARAFAATADRFVPKTTVVAGSQPRLSAETQALLRTRLWAAALMLLLAFLLFFVRGLLLPRRDGFLAAFHILVLAVLGVSLVVLSGSRLLSMNRLRFLEVAIFELVVVFFAAVQYRLILRYATENDPALVVAAMKSSILYILATMVMFGIFIPNTWRRAALVVLPMALTPSLVMLALRVVHPELIVFAHRVASYEQISENVLIMVLGAATSIFGTHVINTLRAQAFEARQLGQYQLRERIGKGGMGEVFLAEHQLLKRPCAIKLIRPDNAADPKSLARFEREVRATAQLSHWNTVEIYDFGRTEDGTFYYVMEYLPGLSFAELVEQHGPLPPERVIHLIRQACHALREAHALGLIHRDIKPDNILASHRGGLYDVTKLLDFGLVKPMAEAPSGQPSPEGVITGSPLFMAPEQASGSLRPDRRGDLYSLGAVAYYLLTGRPPFQGETAMSVMRAHARDPVAPPSHVRPGIPADLERVVLRCLAKDPTDRFPDAESLESALADCEAAERWTQSQAAHWWRSVHHPPTPMPAPSLVLKTSEFVS